MTSKQATYAANSALSVRVAEEVRPSAADTSVRSLPVPAYALRCRRRRRRMDAEAALGGVMSRRMRLVATVAVLGLLALVMPASASAVGSGTWTKITKPGSNQIFHYTLGGANQLTVAGQTSPDV